MGIGRFALLLSAFAGVAAGLSEHPSQKWAGKVPICVSRQAFTIRSDTCGPESYRRMFIDVNTSDEKNLFTYNFRP